MKKYIYLILFLLDLGNMFGSAIYTYTDQMGPRLLKAAEEGNLGKIKKFIKSGVDVNVKDSLGYTPLVWASRLGDTDIVEFLINSKANVNVADIKGKTPLIYAAEAGNKAIVTSLLNNNANIAAQDRNRDTALMHAVRESQKDIVELLLAAGGYTDHTNGNGRTVIEIAKERRDAESGGKGSQEILKLLEAVKEKSRKASTIDNQ